MSCCLLDHGGVVVFVVVGDFWGDFVGWWGFNFVCAVWQLKVQRFTNEFNKDAGWQKVGVKNGWMH